MVIKDVLEQLETANHPVARQLHKADNFKVIIIGFKRGMTLKEHTAPMPSRLTVISGSVIYNQQGTATELQQYDEIEIPVNVIHFVVAKEDSLCILTQG